MRYRVYEDHDLRIVSSGTEAQLALLDGDFDAFVCKLALLKQLPSRYLSSRLQGGWNAW